MTQSLRQYVEKFSSVRLAVVGDFVADEFVYGDTSRISREAPVLILNFRSREIVPGGGGNAAMNAASLGGQISALGVVGADSAGEGLRAALEKRNVDMRGLMMGADRFTPTKMRIMAGGRNTSRQQVIRVDHEDQGPLDAAREQEIVRALEALSPAAVDAVLVSDYGLGVITGKVRNAVEKLANEIVVTVDSRHRADSFKNVTAITPNEEEVEELLGYWPNADRLDDAGRTLLERIGGKGVLITRGSQGMSLFEKEGGRTDFPIFGTDEVVDGTGAGDTVISAFTLALGAGASMREAADISNRAAGIVVMKRGTAVVEQQELLDVLGETRP
ncbi:MAG: bifunctional ADP-heptose synthase [bacterium]|nr:bifunctional ADP-heptose synthase [bacterium]